MREASRSSAASASGRSYNNGYTAARPAVIGFAKVLFMGLSQVSVAAAIPLGEFYTKKHHDDEEPDPDDPGLWIYLTIAMVLVLLGGAFAGLTIALMGQDGIYLQVIATSGEGPEQKHAQKVYNLLKKGKHWVLVTLLLSNVIVNETLPIVLDRSLGGGWPAVLGSTVLIVIFGEVIPQSVCVRYGLQIGAFMAPAVLGLMWLMAPVAWPTAKLLDWMLGEDHGTVYKKSGLKTLVTLHKTLGPSPSDRLNEDEVAIISAVLDLKAKPVGDIMTPMEDVFTMSADTVLDEATMDIILSAGYSRIPIFEPGNTNNFVGMLLVKILITYDPEDAKKVNEFALATLPETRPETSCLDIVNFFQEGKSHMVLVSEFPGENYGASGVITLEDVIEELIGEEIIDETDVFIDVHKAIRRLAPAPKSRVAKGQIIEDPEPTAMPERDLIDFAEDATTKPDALPKRMNSLDGRSHSPANLGTSPKATFMRRSSSGADGRTNMRATTAEMREHLKHLGPSNLASRPKSTRFNTVKIKHAPAKSPAAPVRQGSIIEEPYTDNPAPQGGEGEGLLKAGREASDGVQALQQGYGSIERPRSSASQTVTQTVNKSSQANLGVPGQTDGTKAPAQKPSPSPVRPSARRRPSEDSEGDDEVGSLNSGSRSPPRRSKKGVTRSGSITENVIDSGGVRKVVLETNSSSEDAENEATGEISQNGKAARSTASLLSVTGLFPPTTSNDNSDAASADVTDVKKKKKRNRKKKTGKGGDGSAN